MYILIIFYFKAGICWLEVYKCIAESNFSIIFTSFISYMHLQNYKFPLHKRKNWKLIKWMESNLISEEQILYVSFFYLTSYFDFIWLLELAAFFDNKCDWDSYQDSAKYINHLCKKMIGRNLINPILCNLYRDSFSHKHQ